MSRSRKPAQNVLTAIYQTYWAMTPERIATLVEVARRENTFDPSAIQKRPGPRLDGRYNVTERDGIATLNITGPVVRYSSFFADVSGLTSMELATRAFVGLVEDEAVKAIILDINSPGGEVDGTEEFSRAIFDARGRKPIVAVASGDMASAAYWIGSAADEIVASRTSLLGSIGVRAVIPKKDTKFEVEIVSSNAPRKDMDPETESGRADILAVLDGLEASFLEDVARNRGVSVEVVKRDFGQGGVFVGTAAVNAGLADRIATFDEIHDELAAQIASQRSPRRFGASTQQRSKSAAAESITTEGEDMAKDNATSEPRTEAAAEPRRLTDDEVRAQYPHLLQAERKAGADAERARIKAIVSVPGLAADAELLADAIDSDMTAETPFLKKAAAKLASSPTSPANPVAAQRAAAEAALNAPATTSAAPTSTANSRLAEVTAAAEAVAKSRNGRGGTN